MHIPFNALICVKNNINNLMSFSYCMKRKHVCITCDKDRQRNRMQYENDYTVLSTSLQCDIFFCF